MGPYSMLLVSFSVMGSFCAYKRIVINNLVPQNINEWRKEQSLKENQAAKA